MRKISEGILKITPCDAKDEWSLFLLSRGIPKLIACRVSNRKNEKFLQQEKKIRSIEQPRSRDTNQVFVDERNGKEKKSFGETGSANSSRRRTKVSSNQVIALISAFAVVVTKASTQQLGGSCQSDSTNYLTRFTSAKLLSNFTRYLCKARTGIRRNL